MIQIPPRAYVSRIQINSLAWNESENEADLYI